MGVKTHVMVYTSGCASEMGAGAGPLQFLGPLRNLDGMKNWFINFSPLPIGKGYEQVRNQTTEKYLQAAGTAAAMVLDIRKAGNRQWGADWVRYFIGRPHNGQASLNAVISLPQGNETVSEHEVFEAEEAGAIFMAYHKTGDIPPGYVLRPIEGYTREGSIVPVTDLVEYPTPSATD